MSPIPGGNYRWWIDFLVTRPIWQVKINQNNVWTDRQTDRQTKYLCHTCQYKAIPPGSFLATTTIFLRIFNIYNNWAILFIWYHYIQYTAGIPLLIGLWNTKHWIIYATTENLNVENFTNTAQSSEMYPETGLVVCLQNIVCGPPPQMSHI